MRYSGVVVASSVLATGVTAARPRGVGPEFGKFYQNSEAFTCISDPSVQIPFSQVNDDYCDCPDGSDEPGTAACSFLSPLSPSYVSDPTSKDTVNATIALPGFYCKNKGHTPTYLPFTNVNDGVCDYEQCCDGSDEWLEVGKTCPDRCQEIGKEARRHAESRQQSLTAAGKSRKDLVTQAARARKLVEERIQGLTIEIDAKQIFVADAAKELAEIERKEKGRIIRGSVDAKAGKLGVLVVLAKQRAEELRNTLLRTRTERDANIERVAELEAILSTFKTEYNPNFNDEGVKRAVRAWEDYAVKEHSGNKDEAHEKNLDEVVKSDEENGITWEDYTEQTDSEVDLLYSIEAYLPPSVRTWVDESLRSLRVKLIDSGILASPSQNGESKAVTDAKTRLKGAEDQLRDMRNDQQSHRDDLSKDYGSDDIFRALKGRCISTDSAEYTYEMCFMERTVQKSRKGGAQTGMGTFTRFDKVVVDDDVPADGKGVGSGERLALKFENGQTCWNGPARSTTAILACAEVDEIWKIVEEEKCVYRMEVGTPAACDITGGRSSAGEDMIVNERKDEL